jgi:hypothetical protein
MQRMILDEDVISEESAKPRKPSKSIDRLETLIADVNNLIRQGLTTKEACNSLGIPLSTHNSRLKRLSTYINTK